MRRLMLLGVLTVVFAAAPAGGASATTFSGSCEMKGTILPSTPYTFVPKNMDAELFAEGSCSGTVDDKGYDGPAHLYIDARMQSPMSCGLLLAANVPAVMTFGANPKAVDVTQLDIWAEEGWELFGQMFGRMRGAYNGNGVLHAQLEAGEAQLRDCLGAGLRQVGVELTFQTLRELYG